MTYNNFSFMSWNFRLISTTVSENIVDIVQSTIWKIKSSFSINHFDSWINLLFTISDQERFATTDFSNIFQVFVSIITESNTNNSDFGLLNSLFQIWTSKIWSSTAIIFTISYKQYDSTMSLIIFAIQSLKIFSKGFLDLTTLFLMWFCKIYFQTYIHSLHQSIIQTCSTINFQSINNIN